MQTFRGCSARGTCSANEALTIKRAASSAVGLFPAARRPDSEDVDDLDLQIQRVHPTAALSEGRKEGRGMRVGHKQKACAFSE